MHLRTAHLRTASTALAVAATTAALLTLPTAPSHAASAYSDADASAGARGSSSVAGCTNVPVSFNHDLDVLVENGPATTLSAVSRKKFHSTGDTTDQTLSTATLNGTARLRSSAGRPASIALSFSGTASTTTTKPTGACAVAASVEADAEAVFTTRIPMWATYTSTNRGHAAAGIAITGGPHWEPYIRFSALTTTLSGRSYLPAGYYEVDLRGEIHGSARTTIARSGSGSVSITFTPAGARTSAVSGAGRKYVALPSARTCSSNRAATRLTTSKARAKKISRVVYTVNGRRVATLKGKKVKRGRYVHLPIAAGSDATIKATVVLKGGKKTSASARYVACSG